MMWGKRKDSLYPHKTFWSLLNVQEFYDYKIIYDEIMMTDYFKIFFMSTFTTSFMHIGKTTSILSSQQKCELGKCCYLHKLRP